MGMRRGEGLTLVRPSTEFEAEYQAMVAEFLATHEPWFNNFELAQADFPAFVRELEDEARGVGLPEDVVPQQTFWLVKHRADGNEVVAEVRLRPRLTPPFERHNGHIGYNTRPSQRGRGYATAALALVLAEARRQGLARVMLTVEGDNPASVRVIEKNGGALEQRWTDPASGETRSCFWIPL